MEYINAILLGIVEGLTEFLPISSTGHLILVEQYLPLGDESFAKTFMVVIQLPAILAVVAYFWKRLWPFVPGKDPRPTINLWSKIVVGFFPAAAVGVVLDDFIEAKLMNEITVAIALVVGGIILILLERRSPRVRFNDASDISYTTAAYIGFFQCFAMIPGTSRSAATIIGGLALGASRPAAAEFSFFLAIPTMLGATTLKLLKSGFDFTPHQWGLLAAGSVVSFLVALAAVAWLMRFIQHHKFTPFGYYRIALGAAVLAVAWI